MHDFGWSSASIAGGLVLLVVGAELLVRGASRLAASLLISPLVIGLTVVAYGTSAPEFAVSMQAAISSNADIALGNVVGSNIFNVLFILGISALIVPLVVSSRLVRWDVPAMILVSLLVLLLGWDNRLSRIEGWLLFAGIVAYTWQCIRHSSKESRDVQLEFAQQWPPRSISARAVAMDVTLIIVGLVLLVLGARWLIAGSIRIAEGVGVSQLVIGLTIVAAGTSLPEVATSIVAAVRGERDIAVGNVVGSNIFNILCVLGLSAAVAPSGVEVNSAALAFDVPVMIAVAVACLPIFFTGHVISRWEGGLFLFYYVAYTSYLVLQVAGNRFGPTLRDVMIAFVVPLTTLTLFLGVWRSLRRHPSNPLHPKRDHLTGR